MSVKRLALACAVAVLVSACGGGGTDGPTAAALVVTPNPVNFTSIGQTQQLTAVVNDGNGGAMTGFAFTYTSSSSAIASVSGTGLVTAGSSGTTTIVVNATGAGLPATNVTVNVTQVPAGVAKTGGDGQSGLVSSALPIPIKVKVTDAIGAAVPGVAVAFAALNGGSVSAASVNTNASGEAQVTWTLGPSAGAQSATATVANLSPATFTANASSSFYNIVIRNAGPAFSAEVQTALNSAVSFWQSAIVGDEQDVATGAQIPNACGTNDTLPNMTIDDLVIIATFDSIDGPNGVLGNAGPCYIRTASYHTVVGVMHFDTADVAGLISDGSLNMVVMHEMGHVIGFSTGIWNVTSLGRTCAVNVPRDTSGAGTAGLDSYFTCTFARTAFDSIGGTSFTGGTKVPLENCTGLPGGTPCSLTGTIYSHWRESSFGNELMTGYLNAGANPASVVTIASFKDLGYQVNYAAAQAYVHTFTAPPLSSSRVIDLGGDVLQMPIHVIDSWGRVIRTIQP